MKIFWSWQSDTPGRTGRHFIRRALLAAVNELKQPDEVEEPTEREAKDALHLDQDRQGVSGSPDLAPLILAKIDASTVIVADVTPVSTILARMNGDEEVPEKRNMNPNVAIELGYGIRALTDRNFLMVLNTHYGGRSFLPFDLSGKGGPIIYSLPPDADNSLVKTELANLKGKFVEALRPFVSAATALSHFEEAQASESPAVYFAANEVLATFGSEHDKVEFSQPDGKGFYLRVIPRSPLPQPYTRSELINLLRTKGIKLMARDQSGMNAANSYGAVAIAPVSIQGGKLAALTQLMLSGEIWGVAPWLLISNHFGNFVPCKAVEEVYRKSLRCYVDFISLNFGMKPPYTVEAGAVGLHNRYLAVSQQAFDWPGPFHDDEFKVRMILNDLSDRALNVALLKVFEELFRVAGEKRPARLFDFPPLD